ncbi:amino acid ABC transporter permease [Devosia sp. A369]
MSYTFHFDSVWREWPLLLEGIQATLTFTLLSMVLGLIIAVTGAAVLRFGPIWAKAVVRVYVGVFRNTPLVVQLFFIYFGLPSTGLALTPDIAAMIGLTLNFGAYSVEIIRSGTLAVPQGLIEAARVIGLNRVQTFVYVMLRPALIIAFPALSSQIIVLLLATSVISIISANELTAIAGSIQSRTFRSFEVYIFILVVYLGLSSIFKLLLKIIYDRWIAVEQQRFGG